MGIVFMPADRNRSPKCILWIFQGNVLQ